MPGNPLPGRLRILDADKPHFHDRCQSRRGAILRFGYTFKLMSVCELIIFSRAGPELSIFHLESNRFGLSVSLVEGSRFNEAPIYSLVNILRLKYSQLNASINVDVFLIIQTVFI